MKQPTLNDKIASWASTCALDLEKKGIITAEQMREARNSIHLHMAQMLKEASEVAA